MMDRYNNEIVLSVSKLCKMYTNTGICANDSISMDIKKGEVLGILGPNGAGKTTLIRQIVGLLKPDSGSIKLMNQDILGKTDIIPQNISYLSQMLYAHKALKVKEFICYTGVYRGLSMREAKLQTDMLLQYFGVYEMRNRLIDYLSGGELQLVGFLGSVIAFRPLIILDEPTNDMDPEKRILLWKMVKELKYEKGITFILVTHNVHEAQDVVDRVAILQNGKIVTMGKVDDIIKKVKTASKVLFEMPYNVSLDSDFKYLDRIQKIDQENYCIEAPREEITEIMYCLLSCGMNAYIRNISIKQPSLEDAYLAEMEMERLHESE